MHKSEVPKMGVYNILYEIELYENLKDILLLHT